MTHRYASFARQWALALIAIVATAGLCSNADAEVYTQIPEPFVTEDLLGETGALSQNDLGASNTSGGFRSDFATAFDNFTFGSDRLITNVSWVGGYLFPTVDPPDTYFADSFTISFFENDATDLGVGDQPGSLLAAYNTGSSSETNIAGEVFSYDAAIPSLAIQGGEKYWISAVANLSLDDNDWVWMFSDIGDDVMFQDFEENFDDPLVREKYAVDFAFSVTAVPEPSSVAVLLIGSGSLLMRRRRKPLA